MKDKIDYNGLLHNIAENAKYNNKHGWVKSAAEHAEEGYNIWVEITK